MTMVIKAWNYCGKVTHEHKDGNEHTGTGQRETQTISTHGGKWGTGGDNRESGKTIRLVTRGKASDLKREKS